jgi:gliding motility-associated-like protein
MTIAVENTLPLFIPNSLSPNGDGVNDVFEVYGAGLKFIDMKIFDRWRGECLTRITKCRDGMVPSRR